MKYLQRVFTAVSLMASMLFAGGVSAQDGELQSYQRGSAPWSVSLAVGAAAFVEDGVDDSAGLGLLGVDVYYHLDDSFAFGVTGEVLPGGLGNFYNGLASARYYVSVPEWGSFRPYLGFGLGVSHLDVDFSFFGIRLEDSSTDFMMQGTVGVEYEINSAWSVLADFRAAGIVSSDDFDTAFSPSGRMGVRYRFGSR